MAKSDSESVEASESSSESIPKDKKKKHIPKENKKVTSPLPPKGGKPKLKEDIKSKDKLKDLIDDEDESPFEEVVSDESQGVDDEEPVGDAPEGVKDDDDEEVDIYAGLSPEERAEKEKEEYIWRFRILKKKYGKNASIPIPEWNEFSDLGMMKQSYERTIKELYLDDAVETYRTYLLGAWIVMEYTCTQFVGIDLRGFTSSQIRIMHKYDRMLIELGEKSYTNWAMNLPVEVRLIGMVLFQAAIFYLGKIISDKMGSNVGELFRGFSGQAPVNIPNNNNNNEEEVTDTPKPKMKGPKINADQIRERNNKKSD